MASSTGAGKGSGDKDVRTTEPPLLQEPSADVEDALARETSALDLTLVLGCGGVINNGAICGLLT
jgi:hypothetical protein